MESGYGGPVWHASIKAPYDDEQFLAFCALNMRGDSLAGEWLERGPTAFHLRRRLSAEEVALAGGLAVRDIRGTDEHKKRQATILREFPAIRAYFPQGELL